MTRQSRTTRSDTGRERQPTFARGGVVAGLLLLVGGWMPLALAIDPPPPAKPPAEATKTAADKPAADKPTADKPPADSPATDKAATDKAAADAAKPAADDDELKPPPPTKTPGKSAGSPQRFEPSEQVRPDFDVSFPIDI